MIMIINFQIIAEIMASFLGIAQFEMFCPHLSITHRQMTDMHT